MLKRFFSQCLLALKDKYGEINFWEIIIFTIGLPIIGLISVCVFAGYGFNTTNVRWWVIGSVIAGNAQSLIFSLGHSFRRDRQSGMFRSIITSKTSLWEVMASRVFYDIFIQITMMLLLFFVGCCIFGVDLSSLNFGVFFLILFASILSASGLGLLIGAFGLITDQMHFVANLAAGLVSLYAGASFPISQFPSIIGKICMYLPVTRSILGANNLFDGAPLSKILPLIYGELIIGLGLIVIAVMFINIVKKLAMKKGNFEMF